MAFHRYTFPKSTEAHILFDIGNKQGESGAVKDAKVYMNADGRIEGYVTTLPVYVQKYQPGGEVTMYFSAIVDKKPQAYGVFSGNNTTAGKKEITGKGAGLYLTFSTNENEAITLKRAYRIPLSTMQGLTCNRKLALYRSMRPNNRPLKPGSNTWAAYK